MIRIKSLQQRLVLFLLLPVALLLTGMGIAGFVYARKNLIDQWREAAILKLQRAAHFVDMRLSRPKEWMEMFHNTAGAPDAGSIQQWLLEQLEGVEGVARANLTSRETGDSQSQRPWTSMMGRHGMGREEWGMRGSWMERFHRARIAKVTSPRYDSIIDHETVSLISDLLDKTGSVIGRLEVVLHFDYLIEDVVASSWWQSNRAFLVDRDGNVLTCTVPGGRRCLGETRNPLEVATLEAMQAESFGTILGDGHPPDEVSGFYKLEEAPWTLVVMAPGKDILAPIVRFRYYYFASGIVFILIVLALIRFVTGRTVSRIRAVSGAAERVALGSYDATLPAANHDEVGQLVRSFNTMVQQLEERMRLKEALDLAMEVQQNLLPQEPPQVEGMEIAGKIIYCDETGGDYYDFFRFPEAEEKRIGIAVGDVVGHGISAALLMTTVRALLRSRLAHTGSLSDVVADVNRLLCQDTLRTGDFMSLFVAVLEPERRRIRWVRAGHAPALLYDASSDRFEELRGQGAVIGFDESLPFEECRYTDWNDSQVLVVGTDGIWETENPEGEDFGVEGLREVVRKNSRLPAEGIIGAIIEALAAFRRSKPQEDDITLVVVKSNETASVKNED